MATGIESTLHAQDFIGACEDIKRAAARALISGGVSNVSLLVSRQRPVREAIHTDRYSATPSQQHGHGHRQRRATGDLTTCLPGCAMQLKMSFLTVADDGTERLLDLAEKYRGSKTDNCQRWQAEWRSTGREKRVLEYSLVKGVPVLSNRIRKARQQAARPIEGESKAADGWHERGRRPVRRRKMFLPQGGEIRA